MIYTRLIIEITNPLPNDFSETEHGQVHGDEYDGHEQADQQDQHGFEQVPQRAEAVLELPGQYVAFSGEYFGQPAGLLSHPQQRDEPPVVELLEALQRLRQASSPLQLAGDPGKGDAVRIKHDDPLEHPDALQQRDSGGSKQAEQAAETGLHALFQRVARQRNLQQPSAGEPLYARAVAIGLPPQQASRTRERRDGQIGRESSRQRDDPSGHRRQFASHARVDLLEHRHDHQHHENHDDDCSKEDNQRIAHRAADHTPLRNALAVVIGQKSQRLVEPPGLLADAQHSAVERSEASARSKARANASPRTTER